MITTVIFSKDRACQLEFLLRTLMHNKFGNISQDFFILYKGSTPDFDDGYNKLQEMTNNIAWIDEDDFQSDTIDIIKNAQDYICFFVDDNLMYRQCDYDAKYIVSVLTQVEGAGCFSLRLGLNTTIQDPYSNKKVNKMPDFTKIQVDGYSDSLAWQWTTLPLNNFSYPFSVDGHIYNTDLILNSLDYEFDTPNALEGRFDAKNIPPVMFCGTRSCIINNPMNLVGSSQNKAGVWHGMTLEELNTGFLDDKILQPTKTYSVEDFVGCHQELEMKLVKI